MLFALLQFLDLMLPRNTWLDSAMRRKYREQVFTNLFAMFVSISFLIISLYVVPYSLLVLVFSLGSCVGLGVLAMIRLGLSPHFIGATNVTNVMLQVAVATYFTGGRMSPAFEWLLVAPVLTLFLVRGNIGRLLLLAQGLIVGYYVFTSVGNAQQQQIIPDDFLDIANVLGPTMLWCMLVVITAVHRGLYDDSEGELHKQATLDVLTGLLSRKQFYALAEHAFRLCGAKGQPCGVLMIDLDRLKTINDKLGHKVGDEVIAMVARMISQQLRANDICGRVGGDEFCAVLPNTNQKMAREIGQRLEDSVARILPRRDKDIVVPVSVSIGTAAFSGSLPQATLDKYIADADADMYLRKHSTRS